MNKISWDNWCSRIQIKNNFFKGILKEIVKEILKRFLVRSKNKINLLQRVFTIRAAPISMTQMIYIDRFLKQDYLLYA